MHNDYNLPDPNCGWSSKWSSPIFEKEGAIFRLTIVPWSSKHQQILVKRWEQSPPKLEPMFFCSFFSDFLVSSLNILKPKHKKRYIIYLIYLIYFLSTFSVFFCFCFGTVVCLWTLPSLHRSVGWSSWWTLTAFHSPRCGRSDASARASARSDASMACKGGEPGRFPPDGDGMMGWDSPFWRGRKKLMPKIFFRWFFEVFFFSGKILLLKSGDYELIWEISHDFQGLYVPGG